MKSMIIYPAQVGTCRLMRRRHFHLHFTTRFVLIAKRLRLCVKAIAFLKGDKWCFYLQLPHIIHRRPAGSRRGLCVPINMQEKWDMNKIRGWKAFISSTLDQAAAWLHLSFHHKREWKAAIANRSCHSLKVWPHCHTQQTVIMLMCTIIKLDTVSLHIFRPDVPRAQHRVCNQQQYIYIQCNQLHETHGRRNNVVIIHRVKPWRRVVKSSQPVSSPLDQQHAAAVERPPKLTTLIGRRD